MVLTETDYNDFMISMNSEPERGTLPAIIRIAFASSSLLFIGYDPQDIDFSNIQKSIQGLVPSDRETSTMVVLPPTEAKNENTRMQMRYLDSYVGRMNIRIYWGSVFSFCHELRNRWDKLRIS